jgi:hypothetical protein
VVLLPELCWYQKSRWAASRLACVQFS